MKHRASPFRAPSRSRWTRTEEIGHTSMLGEEPLPPIDNRSSSTDMLIEAAHFATRLPARQRIGSLHRLWFWCSSFSLSRALLYYETACVARPVVRDDEWTPINSEATSLPVEPARTTSLSSSNGLIDTTPLPLRTEEEAWLAAKQWHAAIAAARQSGSARRHRQRLSPLQLRPSACDRDESLPGHESMHASTRHGAHD